MSASFHNYSQQEMTKMGNFIKFQKFSPNSREFPPGIFDVADSREFPGIPTGGLDGKYSKISNSCARFKLN